MESKLSQGADGSLASSTGWPPAKRRRPQPPVSDCCRTCRLRKVKCTGNAGEGPCTNCSRLELTCSFVDPESNNVESTASRTTPSHSHTEAGTLRKRAQRACSQCHAHKTKCTGDLPRCKRCEGSDLACEYTPAKRKFTNVRFHSPTNMEKTQSNSSFPATPQSSEDNVSPPAGPATSGTSTSLSTKYGNFPLVADVSLLNAEEILFRKDLILRHMDAYMEHLYSLPSHGFLHPDSMYQKIHDGTINPALAAAVCSISSVFVNPGESGRGFGFKCNDQVDMYLFQNIQMFSEDTLILFALNVSFNILNGSFAKVWQCFGITTRLLMGLQANWDVGSRDRSFIQQECLRRVAWHVFVMDRHLAGGYEEYVSCRVETMKTRLPCDEQSFRENRSVISERLHDSPGRSIHTGLQGYLIRLVDLRHRIQVTTRKLISPTGYSRAALEPSQVMADISNLQNELTRFHASAPDDVRLSDHSISRYMVSQERAGYVFFHSHLSVCHTDLYRFSLPGQREAAAIEVLRKLPREFVLRSQRQAVAHSLCLGRFAEAIQEEIEKQPNTGNLKLAGDYTILRLATQCVEVLLIALRHNLYQDLENDTTAPLWRKGPTDAAHIRGLIDSLHKVAEPWARVFDFPMKVFEASKASVEEFDRQWRADEHRSPAAYSDTAGSGSSQLPGPDHMLENAFGGSEDEGRRSRSGDPLTPGPWFPVMNGPSREQYDLSPDIAMDVDYGPPGLPTFLAEARRAPNADLGMSLMMFDESNAMMSIPNMNDMGAEGQQELSSAAGGMAMMSMNGTTHPSLIPQVRQAQGVPVPSQQGFVPQQQSLFMNEHTGQYSDGLQRWPE